MQQIATEAINEAYRAIAKYKRDYSSCHEFYGVLLEEIEELWDEIKKNDQSRDFDKMRKEAVQCIAVILRFIKQIDNSWEKPMQ